MDPIVLTKFGETLIVYPGANGEMDDSELSSCIGVHAVCKGFVDLRPISETHCALVCRRCFLRIVVPKEVNTFGKLREWAEKSI